MSFTDSENPISHVTPTRPPHAAAPHTPEESDTAPTDAEGGNAEAFTVLVVDDDGAVLDVACRVLRRAGYEVLSARGSTRALEVAAEHGEAPIDLLLTDIVMPEMSGRELAERLRRDRPELPVLYMSGYTEDQVILQGVRVADVDFVSKPFTLQDLLQAVETALEA